MWPSASLDTCHSQSLLGYSDLRQGGSKRFRLTHWTCSVSVRTDVVRGVTVVSHGPHVLTAPLPVLVRSPPRLNALWSPSAPCSAKPSLSSSTPAVLPAPPPHSQPTTHPARRSENQQRCRRNLAGSWPGKRSSDCDRILDWSIPFFWKLHARKMPKRVAFHGPKSGQDLHTIFWPP